MTVDDPTSGAFSLRRWSRRKLAAARPLPEPVPAPGIASAAEPPQAASATAPVAEAAPQPVTPPVESLTIDSDFTAFLQPKVAESVKRQALKQLFRDPRFNVMDGLDVYVDDYSQPDPISPEVVRELMQARYVFDPPQTRVTGDGTVEDVPAADAAPAPCEPEPVALPHATAAVSGGAPANAAASDAPADPAVSAPPAKPDPAAR